MTWQVLITVFTLGGIGAMIRGGIIMILSGSARIFPMSILIVNILAAFLGGFLLSLDLPTGINAAIAIGLIGGIGTLSAVPGNLLDLFFDKAYRRLALYLGITIFGGVLSAQAGMSIGNFVVGIIQGPQQLQNQMMLDTLKQQEQYLETLKEGDHIDYNNLPSLSPVPEEEDVEQNGARVVMPSDSSFQNNDQQLIDALKRQEQIIEQIKEGSLSPEQDRGTDGANSQEQQEKLKGIAQSEEEKGV